MRARHIAFLSFSCKLAMMTRRLTWFSLFTILFSIQAHAQVLVADRGPQHSTGHGSVGWTRDDKALLADDFQIGKQGEVWMIDRVRTWVVVKSARNTPADLYSNLTLLGGLVDPANSNKPKPPEDCDCHGMIRPVKSVDLGGVRPDLKISEIPGNSSAGTRLFQIDFEDV